MRLVSHSSLLAVVIAAGLCSGACAHESYIPGTTVADNADNQAIINTIEEYRHRLLDKNVDGLLVLASDKYFEDGGTQRADDDYGYDGLRLRLTPLMERVRSILRYEIQYKKIAIRNNRAEV